MSQALLTAFFIRRAGLYHPQEYDFGRIHFVFLLLTASILIISTDLVPLIGGVQLKYILPVILFAVLFLVFNDSSNKENKVS
jgi:hypothetical protein